MIDSENALVYSNLRVWNGANRLIQQTNAKGDITRYAYDGDGNRMKMTIDYAHGGTGNGNGNGNGNGKGNNGNGNGNGNGNNGNGNGNGWDNCKVVPPGFIPPGLAKKCGQTDEEYPDLHPGGPRDGWEKQYKKEHWELNFTNNVSLALPEPLQVTEADSSKWKQSYVYGAGGERLSMTYLPAYDDNNGWEPTPGAGGAEPGVQPKTLWYMQDALGSTLGLVEKDGRVSSRYHYDEFGVPQDAKKFDLNWPGPDNLFGYTGLGYDFTSSNTYARARYYEPEIGRFVSEDTYEGQIDNPQTLNLYTYVENNPLLYTDPSGHAPIVGDSPYDTQPSNTVKGYIVYVSKDQLTQLGIQDVTNDMVRHLNTTLGMFDITTTERIRNFLAQVMHESKTGLVEKYNGTAQEYFKKYDGRMGNNRPGDGAKFRGAGYIQITGRDVYQKFADFMGDQKIVEEGYSYVAENYAWEAAGYFWTEYKKLNKYVDKGASVKEITRRVNGGYNGLSERIRYYKLTTKVIK